MMINFLIAAINFIVGICFDKSQDEFNKSQDKVIHLDLCQDITTIIFIKP